MLRSRVIALADAAIAVDALDVQVLDRFAPDERARLAAFVAAGRQALDGGRAGDVPGLVRSVVADAARVSSTAAAAKQRHDEAWARAQAALADLEAALDSFDCDLVAAWAGDGGSVAGARTTVASASTAIDAERFEDATAAVCAALIALEAASSDAAAVLAQDESRAEAGDAVMDVLDELGFETSCVDGSRTEPLRISDQTATATDAATSRSRSPCPVRFDFEVKATEGDVACAGVIRDLQQRLADRGVLWEVTDWGHAAGSEGQTRTRTLTRTQTQTRTKS